jgi:hypothetical protein
MEDPQGGLAVTSASPGRARLSTVALTAVIAAVAVLQIAIGHRVVLQADGNLASLGSGRTAYAGLIMGVYLLCAGALWLAVSSSSGWPAGPRSAACSASRR